MTSVPPHLALYNDPAYFVGGRTCSGYDDYANCRGVLDTYCGMLRDFNPSSVLDIGAAYGFVIDFFRARGIPAFGVEPSAVALGHVPEATRPFIYEGALPDLPTLYHTPDGHPDTRIFRRFDLVTCTEVLEHVPEALVPASLAAIAEHTDRVAVLLIMLEGPGADGDEGHICLKSREWWNAQLDATGLVTDEAAERYLNEHPVSQQMYWSTRFFVRRRAQVTL